MAFTVAPSDLIYPDQEQLLRRIIHKIRRSLHLQDILDTTAAEVQRFLAVDRVKIYQFHPDESGLVIAEAHAAEQRLPILKGLNFPADDIPFHIRKLFTEAQVRNVVDVELGVIGQNRLRDPETGEALVEDWVYRPLDPCHSEYLSTMGVCSSVVMPIFHQDRLWGLLVAHHSKAKTTSLERIHGVQTVIDQLSVAIAHSELLAKARERADRKTTISHISCLLHSLTTIELQKALEETVAAFQGSGGKLLIQSKCLKSQDEGSFSSTCSGSTYSCGTQPTLHEQSLLQVIQNYFEVKAQFESGVPQPWAIDDLYQEYRFEALRSAFRSTAIRSLLVIPLLIRQQTLGYLSIFRDEIVTETLWAGRFNPDIRQSYPRQSFDIWRQSKTGQVQGWEVNDLKLASALANQFSSAIEQYELYQQVQTLNASLESQVQSRTAELRQALAELQQTQSQLIQNEKMSSLGQLVAGVAHEINNPVNFIHGNLSHVSSYVEDLLALLNLYQNRYPSTDSEIQNKIEEIDLDFVLQDLPQTIGSMKQGTERIRQIVLSLRSFSRLDQAEMKAVNIHEGIDSTLMILQHRFKARTGCPPIKLIKHYGDLPEVECYAGQLNQVFMNLLSNAIDVFEEDSSERSLEEMQANPGIICIQTEQVNSDWIRVSIADNGPGIPQQFLSRIFDPFFTTKPSGKGTGLGLSISYQIIVDKHKGSLQCVSTPEKGTEFIIEIPLQQT